MERNIITGHNRNPSLRKAVIIVAGGSGKRMGAAIPKQFIEVNGKTILQHTIESFRYYDATMQIIVVLPEEYIEYWKEECIKHNFTAINNLVAGGQERYFSVKNGLTALDADIELVAVHDGVRPMVSQETITKCFSAAASNGTAVPTAPLTESLRHIESDGSSAAVPRNEYLSVQTPQCFTRQIIETSYQQPFSHHFTDDASIVEAAGYAITTVEGNSENIKITTPTDLIIAREYLG